LRYRPVTVFRPPLPTVTYPDRYISLPTITDRYSPLQVTVGNGEKRSVMVTVGNGENGQVLSVTVCNRMVSVADGRSR
jgi:hypothetical protein